MSEKFRKSIGRAKDKTALQRQSSIASDSWLIEFLQNLERLGWKIVGPEPSEKMLEAGKYAIKGNPSTWERDEADSAYRAMLAVSPSIDELLAKVEGK